MLSVIYIPKAIRLDEVWYDTWTLSATESFSNSSHSSLTITHTARISIKECGKGSKTETTLARRIPSDLPIALDGVTVYTYSPTSVCVSPGSGDVGDVAWLKKQDWPNPFISWFFFAFGEQTDPVVIQLYVESGANIIISGLPAGGILRQTDHTLIQVSTYYRSVNFGCWLPV